MQPFKHVFVCVYMYKPIYSILVSPLSLRIVSYLLFFLCGREEDRARELASSVQSLSRVWLFATPWTAACQASLSITNSRSLPKLMSIESVIPSNHLILCRPFLLPSSIFPSIRVFSNESALHIRWPKYWSFTFKGKLNWLNRQSYQTVNLPSASAFSSA